MTATFNAAPAAEYFIIICWDTLYPLVVYNVTARTYALDYPKNKYLAAIWPCAHPTKLPQVRVPFMALQSPHGLCPVPMSPPIFQPRFSVPPTRAETCTVSREGSSSTYAGASPGRPLTLLYVARRRKLGNTAQAAHDFTGTKCRSFQPYSVSFNPVNKDSRRTILLVNYLLNSRIYFHIGWRMSFSSQLRNIAKLNKPWWSKYFIQRCSKRKVLLVRIRTNFSIKSTLDDYIIDTYIID